MKRVLLLACASACASNGSEPVNVGTTSAALVDVASFGANPAQLTMHKYVPQNMPADPRPLVVVLHGCTQTPQTYEAAGWDQLADAWKFYLLYPQQNTQRNNSGGCFNWGGRWPSAPNTFTLQPEPLDLTEIQRGHGENESIKEMVDKMKADHPIDPKRVFVTGLSGGGAMTALLLAVWPDVFSAGAIFAGVPYACATSQKTTAEAQNCLKDYTGTNAYLSRTPQQWGDLVRAADPGFAGPYPRVSIWHGTSDFVVNNRNQAELVKQWTNANGTDQTPDATDTVDGFPHKVYKDGNGTTVVETYEITGQSHGTEVAPSKPIDPASAGGAKCGQAGAYILSTNICSTYHAGKFFGLDQASSGPSSSSGGTSGASGGGGGGVPGTGASTSGGSAPSGGGGDTTRSSGGGCAAARTPGAEGPVALAALLLLLGRRRRRSG